MIHSSPHLPARVLLLSLTLCSPLAASAQPAPEGDDEEEVEFEFEASDPPPSETPPTPPPPTVNAADEAREARLVALEDELARLRARLAQVERTEAVEPEGTPASTAAAAPPRAGVVLAPPGILAETRTPLAVNTRARTVRAPIGLSLSGYMQVQYERTDLSEDQLAPGGAPLNEDRFSIRRGRLRLRAAHEWVAAELEIDGSTTNGPSVSVRRANVALLLRNEEDASAPPHAALTVGLTELPYGVELQLGQDEQLFMERSLGSLALFPGPTDVGAVVSGAYGPLRLEVAVMNGTPIDDRAGTLRSDPTRAPDVVGRLGVQLGGGPEQRYEFLSGFSFLSGKGFHPGRDATSNSVQWIDLNEDGVISPDELFSLPGRGATPSQNFDRWALGVDVALAIHTPAGATRIYGEVTMANNLDRGFAVADPITAGSDLRHLSAYVAVVQDITRYGIFGARYDFYDPNIDLLISQRGLVSPIPSSVHTLALTGGVRWPGIGRLTAQYDFIIDHLARGANGRPADLKNNRLTVRLQGVF
jgi:hypothetical protein